MYLKKLELFGFKSFANKTELFFEPGITAVVGPNGCGKSNISDGIKWVLGEQSAKELRGSKMEDVIFNGTDDTQPVNLAEVSLVFSNKDRILPVDYDEVIITRRVFRSGESEYLLNKTQVRLKDIMAMLAGTGIGVSSYSIAEQGKMDRVLHAKPEDRREIFEEASGITKYKNKKKEALNKLEHTENNLIRLADIVNEVKRQIGSIERQAKKAEKYRAEFERMKELDVKFSYHEYNGLLKEEGGIKNSNDSLRQKEGHLSLELNLQQDEIRQQREKAGALDEKISLTKEKASETFNTIDKNENTVAISRERIEELKLRSEALNSEIDEISKRVSELQQKIGAVESEFKIVSDEKDSQHNFLVEAEGSLNNVVAVIKECEKAISDSKVSVMDNAANETRLKNEQNKISATLSSAASRHRRLNIEKDNITRDKASIDERFNIAEEAAAQQKNILTRVLSQLNSLKSVFEQIRHNLQEKSNLIEKLKQRLASAASKLEILNDLKEKREGFSEGVKAYMEFIQNNPAAGEFFVGIVADIIEPKDGFTIAIESALGENSQTIIVKTKESKSRALSYLKDEKKGRAQFIAMDELANIRLAEADIKNEFVAGRMHDFIKAKDEHMPLLKYLLKDIYLVNELSSHLASSMPDMVLVTKSGDVAKGIVTSGGASGAQEYTSIIGRQAKIKEFSNEAEALKRDIAVYEAEYLQMAQRNQQVQSELAQLENTAKLEEIKLNARGSEKDNILADKNRIEKELELIALELEEVCEEEERFKSREEEVRGELICVEEQRIGLESLVNKSQEIITVKLAEKEQVVIRLAELRTQMSLVNERYNAQNATVVMLKDSLEDEASGAELRRKQFEAAHNKSEFLKQEIERLSAENEALRSQSGIVNEELERLCAERKSTHAVINEIEEKIHQKQKELDELRSNISTYHINLSELNYKASSVKERIHSAYRVDIDADNIIIEGNEDWQLIKEEVDLLKERLEGMGPVNLIAIDEHKELQERYEFLTTQQQDLINAKESLHKAINKINRTTRKMFADTFEQIRIAFKEYFKLLFGGGAAELFLLDQADILESGIDIVARPPGKKLQSISLLSGGEKALTAVALLFALFKVRPTPFCVLDEIDAPLDEANIDRFSRLFQEFTKTTQFIIITHNKKTMSVSDVMYGITMQKSGISKIVSVRFAQEQEPEQRDEEVIQNEPEVMAEQETKGLPEEPVSVEPVADTNTP